MTRDTDRRDAAAVVDALRRDLQDGDDLALAMRLVGDALDRRLTRVRRSLEDAIEVAADDVEAIAERLQQQIDDHRSILDRHRQHLQSSVDDVQALMSTAAEDLPRG